MGPWGRGIFLGNGDNSNKKSLGTTPKECGVDISEDVKTPASMRYNHVSVQSAAMSPPVD